MSEQLRKDLMIEVSLAVRSVLASELPKWCVIRFQNRCMNISIHQPTPKQLILERVKQSLYRKK